MSRFVYKREKKIKKKKRKKERKKKKTLYDRKRVHKKVVAIDTQVLKNVKHVLERVRARRVTVQYDIVSCVAMFLASLSLPPLDTQEVSNSFLLLSLSLLLVVSQHWSDRRMIVEHEIYIFSFSRTNDTFFFLSRSIYTAMMEMELLKVYRIFMRGDYL